MQDILQDHSALITESSRMTIAPAIAAITDSGLSQAQNVLQVWPSKDIWQRTSDGLFFRAEKMGSGSYQLFDFDSGEAVGEASKDDLTQIKPNSGIRALIGSALVQFQLQDGDPVRRLAALTSIQRDPSSELLAPQRASIKSEPDADLKAQKRRAERLLMIAYDSEDGARVAAISEMSGDLGVDVRATLNPLLETRLQVFAGDATDGLNIARVLEPGEDITIQVAYDLLVAANLARPGSIRPRSARRWAHISRADRSVVLRLRI